MCLLSVTSSCSAHWAASFMVMAEPSRGGPSAAHASLPGEGLLQIPPFPCALGADPPLTDILRPTRPSDCMMEEARDFHLGKLS